MPLDSVGKYLYIADGDATWNPGFRPTRTPLDRYECRHGLGYTRFLSAKNGLSADLLVFIADDENAEMQVLKLRNDSAAPKTLRVFSYVEWCLWNAEDDAGNLQRNLSLAECFVNGSMICHVTGYRERRAHYAFHLVNRAVDGFDTDRSAFLGPLRRRRAIRQPSARAARAIPASTAGGRSPRCACPSRCSRANREELVFATGYAENAESEKWANDGSPNVAAARRLKARLQDGDHVERAFARAPAPLGLAARRAAGEHAGRAAQRARQHLESLPVHGHVPARAQRLAVRDRPRPRHRLPGLEPGLPRRRPHGAGRGARCASRTSPPRSRATAAPTTSTSR